jgi:hypothetical protein
MGCSCSSFACGSIAKQLLLTHRPVGGVRVDCTALSLCLLLVVLHLLVVLSLLVVLRLRLLLLRRLLFSGSSSASVHGNCPPQCFVVR